MRVRVAVVVVCLASLVRAASAQTLSLNGVAPPTGVTVGAAAPVTVELGSGPGSPTDWIGLYPTGAGDSGYLSWSYLNGTATPPATGLTVATLVRPAPVLAGTYEWRLYTSNSFTRVATSATLTVTASTATIAVNGAVAPTPTTAVAGSNLVVTLANGPGNATDWVALAGVGAPDTAVVDWRYLNNTTVAPTSGMTGGTLTFLAPATPGAYEVRFFAVNSFARLATSGTLTVAASPATLAVNGTMPPTAVPVNAGTYVTVDVAAGPGHPGDWVGLFAANAADAAILAWRYLNGSTAPPVSGITDATLSFGVPLTAGSYEFRFFSANSYTRLATSTSLVVSAATAQLAVNGSAAPASTTAAPGTQAIVSAAAGPGNVGDWVGLYASGAADPDVLDWRYLNDTGAVPATGLTTGTLHFGVPTQAGTYEFRFFMDNTHGRLATSGPLVVPPTPAQIAVNGTAPPTSVTVTPGSTIPATVTGGPGNATDWVALAVQGAPNSAYVTWQYLNGSTVPPSTGLTSSTVGFTLPAGTATYEIRLFASNSYQRVVTSAAIVASTAPPVVTVALTSPFPGTTFNAPASLAVTASATAAGGSIQRVDFHDGAGLIGSASVAPYAVTWVAPTAGTHTLTAVAVDQTNATTTSASVAVTIGPAGATAGTLAAPVASPPGGAIASGQLVTLTAAPGTTVHYTMDGSVPDQSSLLYSGPVVVSQSMVLRARAYQAGWTESVPSHDSYVIDTTGPTIVATIAPGPNTAGWNNTPVTVSFECVDASTVTSCPGPVAVTQEGAGQLVSVSAVDALGHQSTLTVTINIDSVAPVVTLSSPTADLSTTDTTLLLTGTVTDAGSGVARAQCGAENASLSGATASCSVPLAPGQNTVVLAAVDAAGNSASAGIRATRTAAPTAIVIAPTTVALAVGDTRGLTATSDATLPVTGLTWATSDASVVSIDPANDGTIVAEALGQATVTATLGALTATATVRVLPGAVAPGEAIWTAAPTPGRYLQAPMRANPVLDDDPDIFSVEVDPVTSGTLVKAVRGADGATLWSEVVSERPQTVDAFGGVLVRTILPGEDFNTSALRRLGGGGIVPWTYLSSGSIGSATASPDGTVYLTEYLFSPATTPPTNENPYPTRADTFLVGLDGVTGAVRFRRGLPNGTARWPQVTADQQCIAPLSTDGGTLGPITVLENGDAAVQQAVQHFTISGGCYAYESVSRQVTLSLWRVTPAGAASATTLHGFSNTWPGGATGADNEELQPSVNRPDGHGGILASWQRVTADAVGPQNDGFVSRVADGSVAFQQPAPWAQYSDDRERPDVMVTSNGTIYLPDGPGGELRARSTATWATQWTAAGSGLPVQGLDNGGLQWLTWDGTANVVQELDAAGAAIQSAQTDMLSPMVVLRDQGMVYGLDGAGSLAVFAVSSPVSAEWTFLTGAIGKSCKAPEFSEQWKHLQAGAEFTYRFGAGWTEAGADEKRQALLSARLNAVRQAFERWNLANLVSTLNTRFVEVGTGQPATIIIYRTPIPQNERGEYVPGGTNIPLHVKEATGFVPTPGALSATNSNATITLNASELVLYEPRGFLKATLHEIGHLLGLGDGSGMGGSSVMNQFRHRKDLSLLGIKDDFGGNLPTDVEPCDRAKAFAAPNRPWPPQ